MRFKFTESHRRGATHRAASSRSSNDRRRSHSRSPEPATLDDLTPRQIAVASLVAHGYRVKQIAGMLEISERGVRCHISSVAHRCHLDMDKDDKVQVALWYQRQIALSPAHLATVSVLPIRRADVARAVA